MRITESQFVIESHNNTPLYPLTKKQAEQKIRDIMSHIYLYTNHVKEINEVEKIIRQLYRAQITPEKAVMEANHILEIKNSYTKMYKSFLNNLYDIIKNLY